MGLFEKTKASIDAADKRPLGRGIFRRCDECGQTFKAEEFVQNFEVCPGCGRHYRLSAEAWIDLILDPGSWEEHDAELSSANPLGFVDSKPYPERVKASQKKAGVKDAMMTGSGRLQRRPVQLGLFNFRFMGGSMGSVVGEKITRCIERATDRNEPLVLMSSSGGARMQEGALSLMQMAKTVSALRRHQAKKLPFISVMLDPTTGGVAASFAFLGDVNIAEPKALIGFAGQRVIEQTIRQQLPEGFQRAEYLLDHGMVDIIAPRHEMRSTLVRVIDHLVA